MYTIRKKQPSTARGQKQESISALDRKYDRRSFLAITAGTLGAATAGRAIGDEPARKNAGLVVGFPEGAQAGNAVLADGGNAVDAIVAAALVAGVVAVTRCGIGGYGGVLKGGGWGGGEGRSVVQLLKASPGGGAIFFCFGARKEGGGARK